MAVQDDRREQEMCQLIGLRRGNRRSGVDAFYDLDMDGYHYPVPIELKSTTTKSVSTARDVGPTHIAKWRARVWIFGFYDSSGRTLKNLLTLGPSDMETWIRRVEEYIAPDFAIGELIAQRLTLEDLYIICGEKHRYTIEDAQALHKRQWKREKYLSEMDIAEGYTPRKMLEILRLRALYLNARGSTLNNPHIPKAFFSELWDQALDVENTDTAKISAAVGQTVRSIALADELLQ